MLLTDLERKSKFKIFLGRHIDVLNSSEKFN